MPDTVPSPEDTDDASDTQYKCPQCGYSWNPDDDPDDDSPDDDEKKRAAAGPLNISIVRTASKILQTYAGGKYLEQTAEEFLAENLAMHGKTLPPAALKVLTETPALAHDGPLSSEDVAELNERYAAAEHRERCYSTPDDALVAACDVAGYSHRHFSGGQISREEWIRISLGLAGIDAEETELKRAMNAKPNAGLKTLIAAARKEFSELTNKQCMKEESYVHTYVLEALKVRSQAEVEAVESAIALEYNPDSAAAPITRPTVATQKPARPTGRLAEYVSTARAEYKKMMQDGYIGFADERFYVEQYLIDEKKIDVEKFDAELKAAAPDLFK